LRKNQLLGCLFIQAALLSSFVFFSGGQNKAFYFADFEVGKR